EIKNLALTPAAGATNVGFFGVLDAAGSGTPAAPPAGSQGQVTDLFFRDANVNAGGATNVGIAAGQNFGLVQQVGSSGAITATGLNVGGLVGSNAGLVTTSASAATL